MVFTQASHILSDVMVCLAVLYTAASVTTRQAPGDEDEFCTSQSVSIIPPSYPANIKVLMDSYNYVHLLTIQSIEFGAWQQMNVSSSNFGAQWVPTGIGCRQSLMLCYFLPRPSQSNWLITQYISRAAEGGVILPQVAVQVEFEGCFDECRAEFILNVYETSAVNATGAKVSSNYRQIQSVTGRSESSLLLQNVSIPVDFITNESGFYLSFVDISSCLMITRVIVLYYVCPAVVQDLVIYPQTLSPPIDILNSKNVRVQGNCVEGAEGELDPVPILHCSQSGKWDPLMNGTGCHCSKGYIKENASICSICSAGYYVSFNMSSSCQPCPPNTRLDLAGVTECQCLSGYFRAAEEAADFPCTRPPSQCTNLEVVSASALNIVVQWNRPIITGRPDFFYKVFRSDSNISGEFITIEENFISTNSVVTYNITNLQPSQTYKVMISTHNSVSDQDSINSNFRECKVTAATLQIVPPSECTNLMVTAISDQNIVIQWNRPDITGGYHFFYKLFHSDLNRLGEFVVVDENFVNTNAVVTYNFTKLIPFQMYRLKVTTHNNVSEQDSANSHLRTCEITASTHQAVPNMVVDVRSFCSVVVWQPPTYSNGDIRHYELVLQPGDRRRIVTNPYYVTSEEEQTSTISVQVRGLNGAGAGSYSAPIAIGCPDTEPSSCPLQNTSSPQPSPTNTFHFQLKGNKYLNNTLVLMEDIGEDLDALLCVSNTNSCCYTGEFYYPNGSSVVIGRYGHDLYRNRGKGLGFIRLNRRTNVTSPEGRYQCVIPGADGQNQSLYINIVSRTCPTCPACEEYPTNVSTSMCPTCPSPAPTECPEPVTSQPSTPSQETVAPSTSTPTVEDTTTPTVEDTTTPISSVETTSPPIPGLYFELRGKVYQNNSVVSAEDIGQTDTALLCVNKDNPLCCNGMNYFYPNGTRIPSKRDGHSVWRNRGQQKSQPYIRLNRNPDRIITTGVYRCEIPFSDIPTQKMYITIT